MPTALDKSIRPVAANLISQFGALVTFEQLKGGSYDVTTGEVSNSTGKNDVRAIVKSSSRRHPSTGESILEKRFTIAAASLNFEPTEGMSLVLDKKRYRAVEVNTQYSGEQAATYTVVAHRAGS
jgi:hypothetical protein